ncbi:hypothetical protein [Paenibacillus glufosinatiresistens]|uniref:hypothetical protein n=1 Tax=Paenibacillus glufosinatiresistens TaxID=3070657 RepID=UPI00286DC43C|nr:hypothetical protein [Paenibacillus sp. YX.27]
MARLVDFASSVPTPVTTADSTVTPVPLAPAGVGLAFARVNVSAAPNAVQLVATVGVQAGDASTNVLLRFLRDSQTIFYALYTVEEFYNEFAVITIQHIDQNVAPGPHDYAVSIERQTPGTAYVVGPVTLSATSIAR